MKETEDVAIALLKVGKLVVDRLKDGVDMNDAVAIGTALLVDPAMKATIEAAIKDADKVDEEIKAAGVAEWLQLSAKLLPELSILLKKA